MGLGSYAARESVSSEGPALGDPGSEGSRLMQTKRSQTQHCTSTILPLKRERMLLPTGERAACLEWELCYSSSKRDMAEGNDRRAEAGKEAGALGERCSHGTFLWEMRHNHDVLKDLKKVTYQES